MQKKLNILMLFLVFLISQACEKPFSRNQFPGRWQMTTVQLNGFDYDMRARAMFLVLGDSGHYWSVIGEKEEATGTWELKADLKILIFTEKGGSPRINQIRKITKDTLILYREEDKAEASLRRVTETAESKMTKEQ